jgi:hypothetical protein
MKKKPWRTGRRRTIAARTNSWCGNRSSARGLVGPVGLNEMIRLLAMDNLIPSAGELCRQVFLPARK